MDAEDFHIQKNVPYRENETRYVVSAAMHNISGNCAVQRQDIHSGWSFKQSNKVMWHNATVPGTVHTDLMACGIIQDPFIEQNERSVQWVDKEDWLYETSFDVDRQVKESQNINLVFDGLDTYADVYLNDSLILKADNMFRQWKISVANILKDKANKLRILFHSPIKVDLPKFESLPFRYEAVNDQSENGSIFDKKVSVFARKAGYHYGWDWGPRLVTSGIWRPVYLEVWTGQKIEDVFIRTASISDKQAEMVSEIEIFSDCDCPGMNISILNLDTNKHLVQKDITLNKGLNTITLPFKIRNPKLWWCNGLGEPYLYNFRIEISDGNGAVDSKKTVSGVRKIEVIREQDKDGRSFYFKLNGKPVFAKGANYIPCDNFLPRVTPEIYRRTIQDAADANMNMLRVWGGGIYENDRFYNLCDSLGIMVWQDFMFACSLYPVEGDMLENVRQEAIYNVRRLRNHPSIALWCGNNECLEAWYNWDWKNRYEKQGFADTIWGQYVNLFHNVLPEVVQTYSPDCFYWPSSPFSSIDAAPESNMGDSHMWKVWGSGQPVDMYNQTTSRFFSEYGFQSFPELETVLQYAPDTTQHFIDSDVMLAHQRAGSDANRKIEKYLLESYKKPKDFNSFLYMTQVLQGDAVKTAIEAHRRNRPYCMGTLFWQHNDCWPVASWSSRDYYGKWKAQHYFAKKAFRDIMVSTMDGNENVDIYVVSDRQTSAKGNLLIEVYKFDGALLSSHKQKLELADGDVQKISFPKSELFGNADTSGIFVYSTFTNDGTTYENIFLPVSQKEISLAKPEITINVREVNDELLLDIISNTFVRAFKLNLKNDADYFFEDNYFDLIPGKKYSVQLKTALDKNEVASSIQWSSLYDATH